MVKGTPACCSRCAAAMPDMPAPMIATRNSASGATSSLRHPGARLSPSRASSSVEHRQVLVGVVAHEVVDQATQVLALGGRRRHRAGVAVTGQRGGGQVPAPRHLLGGDAGLGLEQPGLVRAQVLDQQVVVAGQLGDGDEQRGHVGPLEGGPDRGVIVGERLGSDVEAHAPPASHAGGTPGQRGLDSSYILVIHNDYALERTGVKHIFLALLASGRTHGYELKRRYDQLFAAVWGPVNIGQIYVTLGRLERDGLVVQEQVGQDGRPDRKDYELTERGRSALDAWLREGDALPVPKSDLVLKLVGASLLGTDDARALIGEHRQRCFQSLRDLDTATADTPGDSVAGVLAHGTALHLQAELQWLDHCDEVLARGPLRLTPELIPGDNPR